VGMKYQYFFAVVDEPEFNNLTLGRSEILGSDWPGPDINIRLAPGAVGVIWRRGGYKGVAQPLAIVCKPEEHRRLFGRFSQIRSDLSPLTTWCHLLTPEQFHSVDSLTRHCDLDGWEASWTGLVVAEAMLLAERSVAKLRLPACQATQTFAIARTLGLWGLRALPDSLERFELARRALRARDNAVSKLKYSLEPVWATLIAVATGSDPYRYAELGPLAESLRALRQLRESCSANEANALVENLKDVVPEVEGLANLADMTPEMRLRQFDLLIGALSKEPETHSLRKSALTFIAGYLSTVAAGGAPSLSLAEAHVAQWPGITAWAYVLGGIAEKVVWTSSFDGLGRLVARELTRPLRFDEPPTCDFAIEEAQVLIDAKLADPLVHLRIKQARVISVAIMPGANVSLPLPEGPGGDARRLEVESRKNHHQVRSPPESEGEHNLNVLAESLWPHLKSYVERSIDSATDRLRPSGASNRKGGKKKESTTKDQSKLFPRE
jgi:hypothetical protein